MSPRPKNTHVRRQQIARAALQAIAECGFHDVRIADIAQRAGTSAPGVLYHFKTKDEILDAAVSLAEDDFYADVDAVVREPERAREWLVRLLERGGRGDPAGTLAMWKTWLEIWTRALRDRHTGRTRQLLDRRWRATLATAIRGGQTQGDFATTADAELVALQLASLIDGLAIQFALGDPDVTGERMAEVLVVTAERLLDCDLGRYRDGATQAAAHKASNSE
jgi:AcrR family transcriptional regulator